MVFIKKLKGGNIISNKKLKGSGLTNKSLKKIINATYKDKEDTPFVIDNYVLDDDENFSTDEVKVYTDWENKKAVVAIRGTKKTNINDILADLNLGKPTFTNALSYLGLTEADDRSLNLMKIPRFESAKKILDNVIEYYHDKLDFKIDVVGHSLGGKIAYEISRNEPGYLKDTSLRPKINNVITLNSAGTYNDKKTINPPNKYDIVSKEDFLYTYGVGPPKPFTKPDGSLNTIYLELTPEEKDEREKALALESTSVVEGLSPVGLLEHKTDVLDRIPAETFIGSGISKKKLKISHIQAVSFDSSKWTTTNARKWLKKNKLNSIKKVYNNNNNYNYVITEPDKNKYKYKSIKTNNYITYILGIPK
jgi:hypothetical protein